MYKLFAYNNILNVNFYDENYRNDDDWILNFEIIVNENNVKLDHYLTSLSNDEIKEHIDSIEINTFKELLKELGFDSRYKEIYNILRNYSYKMVFNAYETI